MNDITVGSVIQAKPEQGDWGGCLLIVDEVKSWGAKAYMLIPKNGITFLRLKWDDFEVIGEAVFVKGDEDE